MYCIIWKINNSWQLFTNEVWLLRDEAVDYAKRNKFPKKVEWKIDDYKKWFQKEKGDK